MRIVSPNWFDAPGDTVDKSNGVSAIAKNIVYIRDAVDKIVPNYTDEQKMFATACIDLFKHLDSGKLKVNMISKAVWDNRENILSVKNVSVSYDEHLSYSETFHQTCILSMQVVAFASFLNHSDPKYAINYAIDHVKVIKDAVYAVTNHPSGSKRNTVLQIVAMYFQDDNFVELVENYQSEDFLATFQKKIRQTYLSGIPDKVVFDLDSKTANDQVCDEQHVAPDVPVPNCASPTVTPLKANKRSVAMRNILIAMALLSCVLFIYSVVLTFSPGTADKLYASMSGTKTYEEKYKDLKKKYVKLQDHVEFLDYMTYYKDGEDAYDPVVYITYTGSKYHRDGCKFLQDSKIPMHLSTVKGDYDPCTVCNPPE